MKEKKGALVNRGSSSEAPKQSLGMTTVPQAEKQPVLIAAGGQRASGGGGGE